MAAGRKSGIFRAWRGMRAGSSGCAISSNSASRAISAISPCSHSAPRTGHRPADEVNHLMGLFVSALEGEVSKLHKNGVRLRVIGDLHPFTPRLQALIASAEARTAGNNRLTLTIAANYGGQWDIKQAFSGWLKARHTSGNSVAEQVSPEDIDLKPYLSMAYAPDPESGHSHRRRTAHQQFPAVAERLRRTLLSPTRSGRPLTRRKWSRPLPGMRSGNGALARPASKFRPSRADVRGQSRGTPVDPVVLQRVHHWPGMGRRHRIRRPAQQARPAANEL